MEEIVRKNVANIVGSLLIASWAAARLLSVRFTSWPFVAILFFSSVLLGAAGHSLWDRRKRAA